MEGKHEISSLILRSLHPADFLMASLKLVVITGVILASPILMYFVWEFIAPAMTNSEKRMSVPIFCAGLICFLLGVAFCYFVMLRFSLGFLWNYTVQRGVVPDWTFDNYVSFVSAMMLAFGVTFEFPVVAAFLTKMNLMTSETLKSKRRYAYLAMVILAAILTPPDVFSQMLLCIPMVLLYEVSIGIAKIIEKKRTCVCEE
jgi:sec-independent protein translocase protein TatC